ncbi:MAG: peptidase M29 [Gammaproteobacteria bacterium]|nr:peptidase M29 [Gammaproteobacteria bacterium]
MLQERIEEKWIRAFIRTFELCEVTAGDEVVILSETQSRAINVQLAELALLRMGARPCHVVMPTPAQEAPVPVRSTGSTHALDGLKPVLAALTSVSFIADLTVEGIMHAPETPKILGSGARALYISNEHPEALERLQPDPVLFPKIQKGRDLMLGASRMHVASSAGTDLTVVLAGARVGGNFGVATRPGQLASWPGGICSCFPPAGSVNGTLVLDAGDINLTFKRYLERPIRLTIKDDFVTDIEGDGLDADLMRSYFEAWGDRNAYGVSHVGWGMNPAARWDALVMYDKRDTNGTEQRAFAGNFLYSTGANPSAERYTLGHFDLPVRHCDISLDDTVVAIQGRLQGELA